MSVAFTKGVAILLALAFMHPVDPRAVPLGDGKVTDAPRSGWVDSCVTRFDPNAGGAQVAGPWLDEQTKTWNAATKPAVAGAVSWPQASYSVRVAHGRRIVTTLDVPTTHTTGRFPVQPDDPAWSYDRNPNRIEPQRLRFDLPLTPKPAARPSCVGLGAIGVLTDGIVLYDALDAQGRDAGAHEVLDSCAGHPDHGSVYHHHGVPSCILAAVPNGTTRLVGYARDGYGIYVAKDLRGNLPTDADLDACHGTTSSVPWNGKRQRVYHYVATLEYPYTVGCYRGTPVR